MSNSVSHDLQYNNVYVQIIYNLCKKNYIYFLTYSNYSNVYLFVLFSLSIIIILLVLLISLIILFKIEISLSPSLSLSEINIAMKIIGKS